MQWKLGFFFYNENHGNKNYIAMEIRKKMFYNENQGNGLPWKSGEENIPCDGNQGKWLAPVI